MLLGTLNLYFFKVLIYFTDIYLFFFLILIILNLILSILLKSYITLVICNFIILLKTCLPLFIYAILWLLFITFFYFFIKIKVNFSFCFHLTLIFFTLSAHFWISNFYFIISITHNFLIIFNLICLILFNILIRIILNKIWLLLIFISLWITERLIFNNCSTILKLIIICKTNFIILFLESIWKLTW